MFCHFYQNNFKFCAVKEDWELCISKRKAQLKKELTLHFDN